MRIVIQRVRESGVVVDGREVGKIASGMMLLVGFGKDDTRDKLRPAAEKLLSLRLFPDAAGRFQYTLGEIKGGVLVVPQFTLYADTNKGRRPDFSRALAPEPAKSLFEQFVLLIKECYRDGPVECGVFGAEMAVSLVNDGPVTILLEF